MFLFITFCLAERSFRIVGDHFEKDGEEFRYISGSFHYFRQHPDYWEDNIKRMANGGLNAVQTYVAWNIHEPHRHEYVWDGLADLPRFLDLCAKYNLLVIFRPGPFICAEFEAGGFPYWLPGAGVDKLRSLEGPFCDVVDEWFTVLFNKVNKYLYKNGGPIISIQVENEYGVFACDKAYMQKMCEIVRSKVGDDVILFTTDTYYEYSMGCGTVPDLALATVDFPTGTDPKVAFEMARKYNKGTGPLVDSEYYTGWIDHWGQYHHTVSSDEIALYLDQILACNASVNIYMYYGGTNFGFYAGANPNPYQPDPTSYDYDAPLSEAGDMTWKWQKCLEVIKKYRTDIPNYDVKNTTKLSYGNVTLEERVALFDILDEIAVTKKQNDTPLRFEELDNDYGFVLYETETSGGTIKFDEVCDRVLIYVDSKLVDVLQRDWLKEVKIPSGKLQLLVENLGRVNVAQYNVDTKGIGHKVTIDGKEIKGWTMYTLPLNNLEKLKFKKQKLGLEPIFYRGTFEVSEIGDTYLNPTGLKHGFAFLNGFNLGRYWTTGPQLTLYCPAPVLKKGTNEIIIFETDDVADIEHVSMDNTPQIDTIPHPNGYVERRAGHQSW